MTLIEGPSVANLIGISNERHETIVKKAFEKCIGQKVDTALMKLWDMHDLDDMEKLYVAFRIGKVAAISEVDQKTGGIGKRLGLFR